jgi:hypothetical protein
MFHLSLLTPKSAYHDECFMRKSTPCDEAANFATDACISKAQCEMTIERAKNQNQRQNNNSQEPKPTSKQLQAKTAQHC